MAQTLSVMMLTLNEEKAIAKVVQDIRRVCGDCEVVVVDSSTDQTPKIAEELGCRVIRQFPPRGYGNAFDAGLKACSGDVIVTLDCDDTYPVETVPILLAKMKESPKTSDKNGAGNGSGYHIVSASRLPNRPMSMPLPNYIANWIFSQLSLVLCGVRTTDVHTGMRAYTREVVQNFKYDPVGLALPVELYIGPARAGYHCTEIFIEYRNRIGESKLDPIPGTVWTLKRIWKFRRWAKIEKRL